MAKPRWGDVENKYPQELVTCDLPTREDWMEDEDGLAQALVHRH